MRVTCPKISAMSKSEECIAIIDELVALGRTPDAFEHAFPDIHHFKNMGGTVRLKGFY